MTPGVKERILITVRTYPVPSARYIETVCTAGITDKGEWRRLYPVPHRYLPEDQQYRTYNVVELNVGKGKDNRPETRTPNLPTLRVIDRLEHWETRCQWVNPTIFASLEAMQAAGRTIGGVAVREVLDLTAEPTDSEWSPAQQEKLKQLQLFDEQKPLEKIPFEFRFIWRDEDGKEHDLLILQWEVCETWRHWRRQYKDPIERIRDKWLREVCGPDRRVSFFVGNLANRRSVFAVCGVFNPPREVADLETLWTTGR